MYYNEVNKNRWRIKMDDIEILSKKDAISIIKDNKTQVSYYIFDEFEIHQCKIPPHSKQEWHKHNIIEEVIVVTKGEICIRWKNNTKIKAAAISKGCILRVKNSVHTIENVTNNTAEFNVFRMVPTGENKREIIKSDKVLINKYELPE